MLILWNPKCFSKIYKWPVYFHFPMQTKKCTSILTCISMLKRQITPKSKKTQCQFFWSRDQCLSLEIFSVVFLCFIVGKWDLSVNIPHNKTPVLLSKTTAKHFLVGKQRQLWLIMTSHHCMIYDITRCSLKQSCLSHGRWRQLGNDRIVNSTGNTGKTLVWGGRNINLTLHMNLDSATCSTPPLDQDDLEYCCRTQNIARLED